MSIDKGKIKNKALMLKNKPKPSNCPICKSKQLFGGANKFYCAKCGYVNVREKERKNPLISCGKVITNVKNDYYRKFIITIQFLLLYLFGFIHSFSLHIHIYVSFRYIYP